jgi:hypothetical protein
MKKILISLLLFWVVAPAITAQDEPQPISITVSVDNVIRVQHAEAGMQLELYSIVGIKLATFPIRSADESFRIEQPKGYYIVKVDKVVRKVIIR